MTEPWNDDTRVCASFRIDGHDDGSEAEVSLGEIREFLLTIHPEMKELAALKNEGRTEEADRRGKQLAATIRAWVDAARNQN